MIQNNASKRLYFKIMLTKLNIMGYHVISKIIQLLIFKVDQPY